MVFEALNSHMTSACGGLSRLGVKDFGVRGSLEGRVESHSVNNLRGFESEASPQATHHARCTTVYVRCRNRILRSDTSRPRKWPYLHLTKGFSLTCATL